MELITAVVGLAVGTFFIFLAFSEKKIPHGPMSRKEFGFGPAGIKAGSPGARMQSAIGNVAKGSAFAAAQSAAMGGKKGTAMVPAMVLMISGMLGAAVLLASALS